jgi:hypothetical protein
MPAKSGKAAPPSPVAPVSTPPASEEPEFVDEPDLPAGEPSGAPTRNTKEQLPPRRSGDKG